MTTPTNDEQRHGQRVFGGDEYGPSDYREDGNRPGDQRGHDRAPEPDWDRQVVYSAPPEAPRPHQTPRPHHVADATAPHPIDPYAADPYAADPHGGDPHAADPHAGVRPHPPADTRPAPAPVAPARKRRRGLVGTLVTLALIALLAGGAAIWEFSTRGTAGDAYAQRLESQNIVLNGEDATKTVTGAFAGANLAALEQMSGTYSRIDLDAVVSNSEITAVPLHYSLFGAPAGGTGEITRVEIAIDDAADDFLPVMFGTDNPFPNGVVTFENDVVKIVSENPDSGSITEMTMDFTAEEGWLKRQLLTATLDGDDLTHQFTPEQQVTHTDWCEDAGLDSYVKDIVYSGDSVRIVWELGPLATEDLGLASCIG